jgi:2-methylisocitrate lyase-like PEP mutase family enzyme
MSRLGMPDLGVATLNDMRDHAGMIASLDRSVPLIADMDTGYGGELIGETDSANLLMRVSTGPLMVGRAVEQYINAGIAGFHIEDQVVNKRCGHLKGKELVSEAEWYARIRAAVHSRAKTGRDIVIVARTDALQSLGYEMALKRLKGALELGADAAFLEGVESKEQGRRICADLAPAPVMLNMVEGGVTPHFTSQEAKEHGFKFIVYPGLALAPVYQSVAAACKQLKETGDAGNTYQGTPGQGPRELFMTCGLKEAIEFDVAAGGELYKKGV